MQDNDLKRFHTGPQHKSEHLPLDDLPTKHPVAPHSPPRAVSAPETTYRTYTSTELSEQEASLEPETRRELKDRIVEVHTNAFVRAFLYMANASRMKQDEKHAAACLSTLQADNPVPDPSLDDDREKAPKYNKGQFRQLNDLACEIHGYDLYANLLNYAGAFFRYAIEGSDVDWPPAQEPGRHDTTPTKGANTHLLRIFRDTHKRPRAFSRGRADRTSLKPDLCLLVESIDKPNAAAHWKDVLVPMEVKAGKMDRDTVTLCARYARAVMQEQFDRKFAFSIIIAGNECRVFYWNVVGAHVTEAINIHQNPETFLQVMGRFATMTPAELGYDTHFSNAGRVLSFQTGIKTHLTIHPTTPRTWLKLPLKQSTPKCLAASPPSPLVLEIKSTVFEAKGLLFDRATRVWKGVAFNDNNPQWTKGKTYIIKQNWADDSRPNEGSFHKFSGTIPAVPRLVCLEECDTTYSFHAQIAKDEVVGTYSGGEFDSRNVNVDDEDACGEGSPLATVRGDDDTSNGTDDKGGNEWDESDEDPGNEDVNIKVDHDQTSSDDDEEGSESGYYLERILLRFVFDREGRSLDDAKSAVELLEATIQWIEGLRALNEAGIIHRDISYGNLMLPSPDDQPKQASIIDFGLAHWTGETVEGQGETMEGQQDDMLPQDSNRGPKCSPQPHFHVTGTLPFVAHELLIDCSEDEEHKHALHHDVESMFWVLLYICLERSDNVPPQLSWLYGMLNSRDIGQVSDAKFYILLVRYDLLAGAVGDFGGLKYFLIDFAKHYQSRRRAGQPIDVEQVLGMAKRGLADAIEKEAELKKKAANLKEAAKLKKAAKIQLKKAAKAKKAKAPKIGPGAGPSTSQKPDSSNPPRINSQRTSDPSKPTQKKRKKNDPSQLPAIDEHQGDPNQDRPPERKKAKTEILDSTIGSPKR